jgi:polysaccharide export outer membrane protein
MGDYTLGIGDTLRINVFGQETLTGEYRVEASGMISFPLIDEIPASGFTTSELENAIREKLDPEYIVNPRVSAEVITYRNIYVLGEVQQPGSFEYTPNMTILQAVALAGGYTVRAKEGRAEITRHVKGALKTFVVDEKTILKPGDTIQINRRWF